MPVTFRNAGAAASAASGNITPALPAGFATNDVAILICAQKDNVVATITAGWNIVDPTNNGATFRGFWAWRRLTAGDGDPTITHTAGDAIIARIAVFAGVRTSGDPHDVKSVLSNAASTTVTATAVTPGTAGSHMVFMAAESDDCTNSAYSGTNPVPVERIDSLTTLGLDASVMLAAGDKNDTTTTGSRTCTQSRTVTSIGFLMMLVPDPAVRSTPPGDKRVLQAVNRAGSW